MGHERGRLNSPNLLKLHNMNEGLCYRQLRIRLRTIRRPLSNFLSKEMMRLARGESRSKQNVLGDIGEYGRFSSRWNRKFH